MALLPPKQDTPASLRLLGLLACLAGGTALVCGCSSSGTRDEGTAAARALAESPEVSRARSLAQGDAPLPAAAEARALARSVEGRADRAVGSGAADLRAVAAGLLERVWRAEGGEADGREALAQYRAASQATHERAACDAAVRAARLAGDLAHDAEATYEELYRAERRFGAADAACGPSLQGTLALLVAFRPPPQVLEAIDEGLASERVVAGSAAAAAGAKLETAAEAPTTPQGPPRIARVEAWPSPEAARIVIVLDRASAYRVGDEALAGGGGVRTFIDFDGVEPGSTPREVPAAGIVARIHVDSTTTGSRVVLDLDGRAWRRVFVLPDPYRVVVDIARHPPGVRGRDTRRVARVVLDPGHGGKDVGAIGPGGIREKDVTLDVAHRVAPVLAGQGIQVVLTRDDDRFVSLEERTARANAFAADLFVSVHCNASESRAPRGIETYVLDTTRDEIAARVAARENATTEAATAELSSILGGMRLADEAARSRRFAHLLQRATVAALGMRYGDVVDGGVHTAGFYVLVGARMPSVLFETSYLSNATDEQRLGSDEGRQIFADAIVNAVRAYREGR